MPREVASLEEFSQALRDMGLIEAAELKRLGAAAADGVLGLSRALVEAGTLTPFQAAAVYQRKSHGLVIGDYFILDKLGEGGTGVVFKARHRRSGRLGALKILPPSFARDHSAVLRLRREVEAASRVQHLNLVGAFDAALDRGFRFVVMDYVEGRDLDRIVQRDGPLPVAQAVDYLIQAARGLEAAHARGIIHRDIKPGNLIVDTGGTVRVLNLGLARIIDANNLFHKTAAGRLTQSGMSMGSIDYMAPEQAQGSHCALHRADIYSVGCTLHYVLTGREPFTGETIAARLIAHMEHPAPSLRAARSDVPLALESAYQKMMAKRPEDRPASMTEVVALLQASKLPPDDVSGRAALPPESKPEPLVCNETRIKRTGPPKTIDEASNFARREERGGLLINHEFNLEDLVMDVRSDPPPAPLADAHRPRSPRLEPPPRRSLTRSFGRPQHTSVVFITTAAAGLLSAAILGFALSRSRNRAKEKPASQPLAESTEVVSVGVKKPMPAALPKPQVRSIFDGKTGQGWMLCNRAPVPPANIQRDGLNPHGTGSYLVVYDQKLGDFVLDFDYKLSKGCNTGIFLRVSDLNNPVQTGIEVALDDARRGDDRDSGGFYGLVAPTIFAQKPAGEWNHMTITALGPRLTVSLNETEVSSMNLDLWTLPGKRPDGSDHRFKDRTVAYMARSGFMGFQDLGADCWFKNIAVKRGSVSTSLKRPPPIVAVSTPTVAKLPVLLHGVPTGGLMAGHRLVPSAHRLASYVFRFGLL